MGEWLKLKNDTIGNYFAFRIQEVTHRESRSPDVMLELFLDSDGKPEFSEREGELDEYVQSYVQEGWVLRSIKTETGEGWKRMRTQPYLSSS